MRRFDGRVAGWCAIAVIALAACKGAGEAQDAGTPPAKAPDATAPAAGSSGRLACDVPEHDWGAVLAGQEVRHVFKVKNIGDGVLRILSARGG